MREKILEKYTGRRIDAPVRTAEPPEADAADDLGCFGWLRGIRDRAVMLELRKRSGNIMAIAYSLLERAEFDPSEGITLHTMDREIRITGRNLNGPERGISLFGGIARHRVPWLREADRGDGIGAGDSEVLIDYIEW
jgi:hypothetical protein